MRRPSPGRHPGCHAQNLHPQAPGRQPTVSSYGPPARRSPVGRTAARTPGNLGDEVNPFGNGFDVYRQHQAANAAIVGWAATKADPATHFIRLPGTVPGAYRFEYAPNGVATGLSVSEPGYDAAGTGLKDGLVLRGSNTSPWQQFIPQPNGTLKNAATGLYVTPNGTGAQLRGTTAPSPWGGSAYTWTDYAHLPG